MTLSSSSDHNHQAEAIPVVSSRDVFLPSSRALRRPFSKRIKRPSLRSIQPILSSFTTSSRTIIMSAPTLTEFSTTSDVPGTESAPTHIVAEQSKTAGNTAIPNGTTTTSAVTAPAPTPTTEPPSDTSSVNAEEGRPSSAAPSVSVVLSAPKTTEELIAARALKRAARRQAIREKAEGHKSAVSRVSLDCFVSGLSSKGSC